MQKKRNLKIINRTKPALKITENKTFMKFTTQFIKDKEMKIVNWHEINHIHLWRKTILLAELVRGRGGRETKAYNSTEASSLLKQDIDFL